MSKDIPEPIAADEGEVFNDAIHKALRQHRDRLFEEIADLQAKLAEKEKMLERRVSSHCTDVTGLKGRIEELEAQVEQERGERELTRDTLQAKIAEKEACQKTMCEQCALKDEIASLKQNLTDAHEIIRGMRKKPDA